MRVYVVTYNTESGDSGVAGVFSSKPTEGHLAAITRVSFPEEIVGEAGEELRLIFYEVSEEDIDALPEPSAPIETI